MNSDTTQAPLQGWQDAQIYVPLFETFHPGKELAGTGLGYVIASQGDKALFVPTHMISGYSAGMSFYSEEMCQKYLQELAPLMNWNQPISSLAKDPAYQPGTFNALAKKYWIDDAGATAGGGRW